MNTTPTFIEGNATLSVRNLRLQKLKMGLPFMINSRELPIGRQCYIEYPDGSIKQASLSNNSKEFIILRQLTEHESITLRTRYNLPNIF